MYELRLMLYAVTVAEHGSFSRAAEILDITQPTLSHQIRKLEDQIGTPLFDRLGRRMRPTQSGEIFLRHAREALRAARAAQMELSAFLKLDTGVLRVGAIQTYMDYLLPEALAQFHTRYPDVLVSVYESSAPSIEQMISDGTLDLGLAFAPPELDENAADVLFEDELVLVSHVQNKHLDQARISMQKAAALPMASLTTNMATRSLIDQQFRALGLEQTVRLETNSVESLIRIVGRTDLFSIVPDIVTRDNPQLKVTRLTGAPLTRQAAILHGRGTFQTPQARALRAILAELTKSVER